MPDVAPDSTATAALLDAVRRGEPRALEDLLARHRQGLRRFVESQFDPRLRARADPSDVVQDTQLEVARRMDEFLADPPMPFHLWVRRKAVDRLRNLRRDHLTRARRSVARERALPDPSALLVAGPLLARGPSPSQLAQAGELADQVARAVARLGDADREVLALRHADDLPLTEVVAMFEKIGRAADKVASGAGTSRRGFLGRCLRVAGGAALAAIPFVTPAPARGYTGGSACDCKKGFPYGCKPGPGYEACVVACFTKCNNR